MIDDKKRHYETNQIPAIDVEKVAVNDRRDLLKLIYGEVNTNYRNLAEIRFKLLGFVPVISVLAWASLLKDMAVDSFSQVMAGMIISSLGLLIMYGIRIYDKRNDELYDDLVSRGRKIEEELGVHTGVFRGRLEPNKKDRFGEIRHGRSLTIIYCSVYVGWSLLILWYVISLAKLFFTTSIDYI